MPRAASPTPRIAPHQRSCHDTAPTIVTNAVVLAPPLIPSGAPHGAAENAVERLVGRTQVRGATGDGGGAAAAACARVEARIYDTRGWTASPLQTAHVRGASWQSPRRRKRPGLLLLCTATAPFQQELTPNPATPSPTPLALNSRCTAAPTATLSLRGIGDTTARGRHATVHVPHFVPTSPSTEPNRPKPATLSPSPP